MSPQPLAVYRATFRDMKLDPEKWHSYFKCEMTIELHQSTMARWLFSIWGTNPPHLIDGKLRTRLVAQRRVASLFREQVTPWEEVR